VVHASAAPELRPDAAGMPQASRADVAGGLERESSEPGRRRGPRRRWQRAWGVLSRGLSRVGRRAYAGSLRDHIRAHVDAGREPSEVPIRLPGAAGLHGVRMALVSDLHVGFFLDPEDLAVVVERVAAARPDAVLLCGDLVNQHGEECELLARGLKELRAPLGVFAVPGNHDYYADRSLRQWRRSLESVGAQVLLNQGVRLERGGAALWIAGVDDLREGRPDLASALSGRERGEPTLLLSHHPDFFPEAARAGIELTLSGHTHGGQVLLGGRTPLRHTRYGFWSGRFERGGRQLYVGRGAGVSFLPVRRGAPPELPIIVLSEG
jgi:predicted MPP superfamily phosphohydrolase